MCWGGDVNVRLKLNTPLLLRWPHEKNRRGLHAQWSMKVARQKRSEICAVRVAKSKKMTFFGNIFFLIRRPRNTERVVISFSMLMRLHARFRTRRDVFAVTLPKRTNFEIEIKQKQTMPLVAAANGTLGKVGIIRKCVWEARRFLHQKEQWSKSEGKTPKYSTHRYN